MRDALDEHRRIYRQGMGRSMGPDLTYTGVVVAGFGAVIVFGAWLLLAGLPAFTLVRRPCIS